MDMISFSYAIFSFEFSVVIQQRKCIMVECVIIKFLILTSTENVFKKDIDVWLKLDVSFNVQALNEYNLLSNKRVLHM